MKTLHCGDCLEVMRMMPDNSVDLVLTDPPYFKVKKDAWDRQWDTPSAFLSWLAEVVDECARLLKPNGSLYCFASPQMTARVECMIGERLNVLNCIRWDKTRLPTGGMHSRACKEQLRSFFPAYESIIFAEHYGADNIAKGEAGYVAKCDELRGFVFEPLRAYLAGEFERAGMLNTEGKIALNVACGFSASSGGMASRHYFSTSQWWLPTPEHYQTMRNLLGPNYLRREYEDLRREYEDLRRPFNVTPHVPYTDTWTFPTVASYAGKHPCEKPVPMLEHMLTASSRPDAVVLDPFMGSGTTGIACANLGRQFIGIEREPEYFRIAEARINHTPKQMEIAG